MVSRKDLIGIQRETKGDLKEIQRESRGDLQEIQTELTGNLGAQARFLKRTRKPHKSIRRAKEWGIRK